MSAMSSENNTENVESMYNGGNPQSVSCAAAVTRRKENNKLTKIFDGK